MSKENTDTENGRARGQLNAIVSWKQCGYAVVSGDSGGLPMVHAFVKTEWEATEAEEKALTLPRHLRNGLKIVEATLVFDL